MSPHYVRPNSVVPFIVKFRSFTSHIFAVMDCGYCPLSLGHSGLPGYLVLVRPVVKYQASILGCTLLLRSRVHHEKCWKRKVVWPTHLRRVTFSIAAPALRTTLHTRSAGSWKPKHRYRYNTQYHLQERSFVAQWSNIIDILNVQSNAKHTKKCNHKS